MLLAPADTPSRRWSYIDTGLTRPLCLPSQCRRVSYRAMTRQCTCEPHYSEHHHDTYIGRYVHLDGTDVTSIHHAHGFTVRVHGGGHVDRSINCSQQVNATYLFSKIVAALKESRPLPWWIGDAHDDDES